MTDRPIYNFGAKEISPLWAAKVELWTLGNDAARVHHAQTSKVMKFALVNVASGSDAGHLIEPSGVGPRGGLLVDMTQVALAWGSGLEGKAPDYTGLDVVIVRDGKIATLYVFLNPKFA